MRFIITFYLFFLTTLSYAQNTYVPDDNFEQALIDLGYDIGTLDDFVPTANINSLTSLDVSNKYIADLTGIEDFTVLQELVCYDNILSSINISQNLSLTTLNCINNNLSSLDVSNNSSLLKLACDNNNLSNLNISSNSELATLSCGNNFLNSLDVSSNQKLINLDVQLNQLNNLDVSNNTLLTTLNCSNNQLHSLNVTGNTILTSLSLNNNQISSIDVTKNSLLKGLNIDDNLISEIDISGNILLEFLNTSRNPLISLDISNNLELWFLSCVNNGLTSLDLSKHSELQSLFCDQNELIDLDLSANTLLWQLNATENKFTSLNVKNGNNTNFTTFFVNNNPNLTCINVDDEVYSTNNWIVGIDPQHFFSEDCSALAVDDFNSFDLAVYPNPVKSTVSISLNNNEADYKLYSLKGQLITKGILFSGDNIIDLSKVSDGMYFITVNTVEGVINKKLIVSNH